MNMTWYRYSVRLGQNLNTKETYKLLSDDYDEEEIDIDCHEWANNFGSNNFDYGFEEVDRPPKAWLIIKIDSERKKISEMEKRIKIYDDVLKVELRKDKIERLKNIINNV